MTDTHPLDDEAFCRRLSAMETRLRYLCKTDEAEFERVVRSLQLNEPKLMCWMAYGKQTRALEFLEAHPDWSDVGLGDA
jgi:hypothetical protein